MSSYFKAECILRALVCSLVVLFVDCVPSRVWYFNEGGWRSGGFPKFPSSDSYQCGSRTVSHQPMRGGTGGASAKIVGGTNTPYGAYPWQSANVDNIVVIPVGGDRRHCLHVEYLWLALSVQVHHPRATSVSVRVHLQTWPEDGVLAPKALARGTQHEASDDGLHRQVEIQSWSEGKYKHHCGGAVVGPHIVLTAAHCITNLDTPSGMRLVLGKHNLKNKDRHERSYKPERVVIHPEFRKDGPHSNDIALIKVKSNNEGGINFNNYVQPICLPDEFQPNLEGQWCTVTGWGAQQPGDAESLSSTLRAASVPLLAQSTCRGSEVYGGRHQSILDSMLCAGLLEGGVDACGGDSGGPLACQEHGKFVLAGVVSWGDGCAKKNRPGVYTRVASFSRWIKETMNKLGA